MRDVFLVKMSLPRNVSDGRILTEDHDDPIELVEEIMAICEVLLEALKPLLRKRIRPEPVKLPVGLPPWPPQSGVRAPFQSPECNPGVTWASPMAAQAGGAAAGAGVLHG
jgi:hypothetical protein